MLAKQPLENDSVLRQWDNDLLPIKGDNEEDHAKLRLYRIEPVFGGKPTTLLRVHRTWRWALVSPQPVVCRTLDWTGVATCCRSTRRTTTAILYCGSSSTSRTPVSPAWTVQGAYQCS